jgi:hypothetical protein
MKNQKRIIIENALIIAKETKSHCLFLFLNTPKDCRWFFKSGLQENTNIVIIIPKSLNIKDSEFKNAGVKVIRSWSGNQTRFSRIKYAFLQGVLHGIIQSDSKVVCVLGPWGKDHLDTITIHDLGLSWSEEFPFDVRSLINNRSFQTVMAVVDIALDIGAVGREGKPVGTTFVVGDTKNVLSFSHQAVFNPFKGYPRRERLINRPEVVESIKELAKLDGAIIISDDGVVEAAGRHLDTTRITTKHLRGLGARHRAAAGITYKTEAVSVVVSESTGRVTIFEKGRIVATLEPVISRRLV